MAEKKEPLLLLDNSTMYVIGAGDYHSTNLTFEEAKAIIDMYQTEDILRCFTDRATEQVLHDFVGIEPRDFAYKPHPQDARRAGCPLPSSGTSPPRKPSPRWKPQTASLPKRFKTCMSTANISPVFPKPGDTVPPQRAATACGGPLFPARRKGTGTQEKIQKLFKIS